MRPHVAAARDIVLKKLDEADAGAAERAVDAATPNDETGGDITNAFASDLQAAIGHMVHVKDPTRRETVRKFYVEIFNEGGASLKVAQDWSALSEEYKHHLMKAVQELNFAQFLKLLKDPKMKLGHTRTLETNRSNLDNCEPDPRVDVEMAKRLGLTASDTRIQGGASEGC